MKQLEQKSLHSVPAAYKAPTPRFRDASLCILGRVLYFQKDAAKHLGPTSPATLISPD